MITRSNSHSQFTAHSSLLAIVLLALLFTACDNLPGNDTDKWRFYQEIRVQGGTSGQVDAAYKGASDYELHENKYYGNTSSSSYHSTYEPYKPYEPGTATQYYRGSDDD